MKLHHTKDPRCPLCEDKLRQAHPRLQKWFDHIKRDLFDDVHISCSFRTKEDQEKAFHDGRTRALWPHSKHNVVRLDGEPESHALDLFQLSEGKAEFKPRYFGAIQLFNKEEGYDSELQWGGNFRTIRDAVHFELRKEAV